MKTFATIKSRCLNVWRSFWVKSFLLLILIVLKLTLISAMLNKNISDFIYAGF